MKTILLLLTLVLSSFALDELTRLESIVKDISKLKMDYADLELENEKYKSALESTQNENNLLREDMQKYSHYTVKDRAYKTKIASLKKEIRELHLQVQNLQSERNKFPKLKMKQQYMSKPEPKKEVVVEDIEENKQIFFFDASSFRVNKDAKIFDAIYGIEIYVWEKGTSFTSNQRTAKWIKITGLFEDRVWKAAPKEMWVKASDAKKR